MGKMGAVSTPGASVTRSGSDLTPGAGRCIAYHFEMQGHHLLVRGLQIQSPSRRWAMFEDIVEAFGIACGATLACWLVLIIAQGYFFS